MCIPNLNPGQCSEVTGLSTFGTACYLDDSDHAIWNTAIIHDGGAFDGIYSAAHELGHLFVG